MLKKEESKTKIKDMKDERENMSYDRESSPPWISYIGFEVGPP